MERVPFTRSTPPAAVGGRRQAVFAAALVANSLLVLALGWLLVWRPVLQHFHVAPPATPADVIERHRHEPADAVLATVAAASMVTDHPLEGAAAVTAARRILRGELALPSLPVQRINPAFAGGDLARGVPTQQLWIASLIVPDLLLRAYEHERDPAFLAAAGTYLRNFIDHEQRQWLPTLFLWNAHAVVNRVPVLVHYWQLTRGDGDAAMAGRLHAHAQRLGAMLAKPSHFVAATNHGVMQNVALIELATAFPALPQADGYRQLALQRLLRQLPFYIADEGPVLEHSAGYHFHGVVATGFAIRVLQAGGQPVPPALQAAHERALAFLATLSRPDRTLPLLGNTYRYQWRLPRLLGVDEAAWDRRLRERDSFVATAPVAGYATWWNRETAAGTSSHALLSWGRFPGHGHARAQEMSLMLWADGTDWSTNTGYWPGFDHEGVELSSGWDGGNGPHVLGESAGAARHTDLRALAQNDELRFVDLERSAGDGLRFRRQVLQWRGATWLVFDSYADTARRPLRVLWTAAPETLGRATGPRQFRFERDNGGLGLTLSLQGPAGASATLLRGSREPFGGWVAFDRQAAPAPALDLRLADPAGWMLTLAQLAPPGPVAAVTGSRFDAAERWQVQWQDGDAPMAIERQGDVLLLQRGSAAPQRVALQPVADVGPAQRGIAQALAALRSDFPRLPIYENERKRLVRVLFTLWACLALVAAVTELRWWRQRWRVLVAANVLWLAVSMGVIVFYLGG